MSERGDIYAPEAYAQGKMIDHSAWGGVLPRKITPSDIDMVMEQGGWLMFIEAVRGRQGWDDIKYGQRFMYQSIAELSDKVLCVLWCHEAPLERKIDSRCDCRSFSVMLSYPHPHQHSRMRVAVTHGFSGERWEKFVRGWFEKPAAVYTYCLSCITGLLDNSTATDA